MRPLMCEMQPTLGRFKLTPERAEPPFQMPKTLYLLEPYSLNASFMAKGFGLAQPNLLAIVC